MSGTKRRFLLLALFAMFLAGSCWADVIGPVAATAFNDSVDWCQFGCLTATSTWTPLGTSQSWVAAGGISTGTVGLANPIGNDSMVLAVQDLNWTGNFPDIPSGMGLIYNNACCGSSPDDILISFNQAEVGVGAYIQADYPGDFTATVSLFDASMQLLGSYSTSGYSDNSPGGALFIGANSTDPVWYALFDAIGTGGSSAEPDFAIGTMMLNNAVACTPDDEGEGGSCAGDTVPEPASWLLMAPVLLGLAVFARRRLPLRG